MKKILVALLCAAMLFSLAIPASAAAIPDGTMIYFEDFAAYTNTADTAATVEALKWRVLNAADGNAYADNTAIWTIEDGKLKVNNNLDGGKDSCVKILDDEDMWEVCQGAFTLQYDVVLTSANDASRYIVVVTHYAELSTPTYNSFHLRIRGTANNQMHCAGSWYTFDAPGNYYSADTADGDGSTTVLFKVFGINYDGAVYALQDKNLTIRVQNPPLNVYNDAMTGYNNYGPTVFIRDNGAATPTFVKVSAPTAEEHNDTGYMFWDTSTCNHSGVAIKAGGRIDGYVDNIMIWTGLVDQPANTAVTYTAPPMPATTAEVTTEAPEVTTKAPEVTTKAPEVTTKAPATTTAAPAATTEAPKTEGGCGSVIGCGVALVALLGGCIVLKKRK